MDGKQIFIFGNTSHGAKPWDGTVSYILPPFALGQFLPEGEAKYHLHIFGNGEFTVIQSLN